MITVKNPSKVFPDGTRALSEVHVFIPQGDFVAIIGLSGAGKSTFFLRTLNRLEEKKPGPTGPGLGFLPVYSSSRSP